MYCLIYFDLIIIKWIRKSSDQNEFDMTSIDCLFQVFKIDEIVRNKHAILIK